MGMTNYVTYFEDELVVPETRDVFEPQKWKRVEKGKALWMAWGVNYINLFNDIGNYSTAIIMLEDGTVKNVPAENIKFIEGKTK